MKIIDNFLPADEHRKMHDLLFSDQFPYFFQNAVATKEDTDYFYFTHMIYDVHAPMSSFFDSIHGILNRLDVKALRRAKVNCYPKTEKLLKHGVHKDYPFKHKGALYSINTCNGGTYIGDKFIPSVANRMLLFDSSQKHNSTTCTNAKCRININFNYY